MNNPHNTATAFQDQLAEIQEIMEREKVELTPEVQDYLGQHIQRITEMVGEGKMPSKEELRFFNGVKAWIGLREENRKQYNSIEMILQSDVYKEAVSRNISLRQWLDLLHVMKVVGEEDTWIDQKFKFPGGGKIEVGGHLHFENCPTFTHLPDNLSIEWNLSIEDCPAFTHLPKKLKVAEIVHLLNPALTGLPDDLEAEAVALHGRMKSQNFEQVLQDAQRLREKGKLRGIHYTYLEIDEE